MKNASANQFPLMKKLISEPSAFVSQGVVYINDNTKIITSDFECSNGVIHFIDKVLFPYELTGKADINTDVCN